MKTAMIASDMVIRTCCTLGESSTMHSSEKMVCGVGWIADELRLVCTEAKNEKVISVCG